MSIINCTNDCVYQKDGSCSLERAVSIGGSNSGNRYSCIHYVEKVKNKKAPVHVN